MVSKPTVSRFTQKKLRFHSTTEFFVPSCKLIVSPATITRQRGTGTTTAATLSFINSTMKLPNSFVLFFFPQIHTFQYLRLQLTMDSGHHQPYIHSSIGITVTKVGNTGSLDQQEMVDVVCWKKKREFY